MTFFDDVVHDGDVFRISEGSSAVFFGDVSGNGTFTGAGTAYFEGDLKPGSSPGSMAFEGNLQLGFLSQLDLELAGHTPGTDYDTIDVGGTLGIDGVIAVSLLDGFRPQIGDRFEVLRFGNLNSDGISFTGLEIGDLQLQPLWSANSLTLVAVPEPSTVALLFAVIALCLSGKRQA